LKQREKLLDFPFEKFKKEKRLKGGFEMKPMKKDIGSNHRVTTFFALESMQLRKSRNQNKYLLLGLYDRTGKLNGYLWVDPVETAAKLQEKTIVKVKGLTKMVNSSLILDIERIRAAAKDEYDIRDFLDVVPGGMSLWHSRLLKAVDTIKDINCRRLIQLFLDDSGFMELFITSPGGISVHHSYVGGLLEHTVSAMELASQFAGRHPWLINRNLVQTGAFLHDIGKTREIYWEIAREYTTEGKLLGHITLGIMMLQEKLTAFTDFPEELANRLRHMIVSQHGSLEHGSAVRPATPEALALHLIEATDARVNHLYCHLNGSDSNKAWSFYDRILETEIYQKKYSGKAQTVPEVAA
jgi:3'-5' exoribonuclease